jgi:23S rRNA (pseudouridine1915-N3)-methyltransferase
MRLTILCVGRLKDDAERNIVRRYQQRLEQIGPPLGISGLAITELMEGKAQTAAERKGSEAAELRRKIPENAQVAALDERGTTVSSVELARWIGRQRDDGLREICFLIGGPDGLDPAIVVDSSLTICFGRMTLPHGLVRAVLAEQLYRAATILASHPYHRV